MAKPLLEDRADRKLREIEAMGFRAPSGTGLGW
jgi:hypothetical protein